MSHALLSPSSSERWINCPPSAKENAGGSTGSAYAQQGTDAHALCEYKVNTALGHKVRDPTDDLKFFDEEMAEHTDAYCEFVMEQVQAAKETCPDPLVLVEQRLDFTRWVAESFGTADCVIVADGTMTVIDMKYGIGVLVESSQKPKTDKKDSLKIASYALTYWVDLQQYHPQEDLRKSLKMLNRQYQQSVKVQTMLKNNLISQLDLTFPGINKLFTSPVRDSDGHLKWVDFVLEFSHSDIVAKLTLSAFKKKYHHWCDKKGYYDRNGKAETIHAFARESVSAVPADISTGLPHEKFMQNTIRKYHYVGTGCAVSALCFSKLRTDTARRVPTNSDVSCYF